MTINELFGIRVREQRIALNLSQEKLANIADIDRTYLPPSVFITIEQPKLIRNIRV